MSRPLRDANRLFLLALAALPAVHCKEDEPTLQEQCVDALTAYYECYGYEAPAELDAYVTQYCDEILGYVDEYGEACVEAQIDIMACLSQLGCAMSDDFSACRSTLADAHEACPELFGTCLTTVESGGNFGDGTMLCGREAAECIDGNRYKVDCNNETGTLTCTCTINDAEAGTYAPVEDCSGNFTAEATQACGFPDNTL